MANVITLLDSQYQELTKNEDTMYFVSDTGKIYIGSTIYANYITIDSELSDMSENPVQNKVVTEKFNEKQDTLTAGDNITIENNVISASSSGGGGTPSTPDGTTLTQYNFAVDTTINDSGTYIFNACAGTVTVGSSFAGKLSIMGSPNLTVSGIGLENILVNQAKFEGVPMYRHDLTLASLAEEGGNALEMGVWTSLYSLFQEEMTSFEEVMVTLLLFYSGGTNANGIKFIANEKFSVFKIYLDSDPDANPEDISFAPFAQIMSDNGIVSTTQLIPDAIIVTDTVTPI